MANGNEEFRQKIIRRALNQMGWGKINVELNPEHQQEALQMSLDRYRQRAQNATTESELFVDFVTGQQLYKLPQEIIIVKQIHRRGVSGTSTGTGANLDPFVMQQINTNLQLAGTGGLATYEFFMQYQELVGRMFGQNIDWTYDKSNHQLTIIRNIVGTETVMIEVEMTRSDEEIINDTYAGLWILRSTVAYMKMILGEIYSKFANVGGPNGGITLKGDALKSEAQALLDKLDEELKNGTTDDYGFGLLIT